MRICKIAVFAVLALTSFAAENVAPTKSELEDMYNAAYRAFDANNFTEALKGLDAIDARQPDLAASKNLRGVILMRQGSYDKAEAALQDAARIDPKFWNARFNLAEIPFLKKDWTEARNRFEKLLSSGKSDLAKEASQLIQYKILLTYLLEGKENKVDSILAKLELSPDTPAVDYVKAAVALQQKNEKEAKDRLAAAEKNFSPQLNKLFAESLYEVGWLEKPAGETRPSLPLMTAAERSEKSKATARSKFEQAQQALRQRDFAAARKLVDEADQADPNQPATLNLRGEILMQQKQFDQAEAAFKKAAKLDPKLREAQYNLAQVPFKKKDYAKARERFEALYERTPGGDKNQAAELIKFKIYMTLLLEGKESRAHAMMEEFQFTGDTPALYYAQAAWEFKHNNPEKAADWTASANKIYSPALNNVFADAFYDVGWMQSPEIAAVPTPTFDTNVVASQAGGGPAVEPSPIPDSVFAANRQGDASKGEPFASSSPAASGPNAGMEINSAAATAEQPAVSASNEPATETGAQPEQPLAAAAAASSPSPGESTTASAEAPKASSASKEQNDQSAAGQTNAPKNSAVSTAPGNVWPSTIPGMTSRRMWLVGGLLLAAIFLLAWVIVPVFRRHASNGPNYSRSRPAAAPNLFKSGVAPARKGNGQGNGFSGGPRQISLRLEASKPSLRQTAIPSGKLSGSFDQLSELKAKPSPAPAYRNGEPDRELAPLTESAFESSVGSIVEQPPGSLRSAIPHAAEVAEVSAIGELTELSEIAPEEPNEICENTQEVILPAQEVSEIARDANEAALSREEPSGIVKDGEVEFAAVVASTELPVEPTAQEQSVPYAKPVATTEAAVEATTEEQPVPYQSVSTASQSPETKATTISAISTEPVFPQTTTPVTMPETTQTPTAPINKAPTPPVVKPQQPAATMQTSVQLTFSFEIAAMQLTPSFKMGVLKVRPISKLVMMRLPSSQQAQSPLNLQVGFEVTKIQPMAGALGTIRMVPSQQQRPTAGGLPSFAVAGLQVVPNSETAPVQLTPSQQGRASVLITVPFQITTLEFSPSLEIASVILNSNSKQVAVQLPGAGPSPAEGASVFEIANLELNESGDISMMQLNLLGRAKRA